MPSPANTRTSRTVGAVRRQRSVFSSWCSSPAVIAALLTVAAFGLLLFALRPGYWINDDVKIIWILAGYPGNAQPVPFIVHSNVILGLVLAPLYGIRTAANWFVLLLVLLNACSTWSLLWLVLAARRSALVTVIGCTAILLGVAALTINVTYTMTAFLASVAGVMLLWASGRVSEIRWRRLAASGCLMLLAGSLIRMPMLFMGLLLAIPVLAGLWSSLDAGRLFAVSAALGFLVLLGYGFDRLYVRASPEWNLFAAHTDVREQLQDSHRLNNVHNEIRRVGWTSNDQELFAHWFYPDEELYSLERLRYLVQKVPPQSHDPWGSTLHFARRLGLPQHLPYLLWMSALVAGLLASRATRTALAVVGLTCAAALGGNLLLTITYKDPDYVLVSSLAGSLALSIVYLIWSLTDPVNQRAPRRATSPPQRLLVAGSLTLFVLGAVALLDSLLTRSAVNVIRQQDYARIESDLEALQRDGVLSSQALIVSPAHGLPYEWAYPLTVDLPSPAYFDTGWITFSPAYYRVLNEYGITSLPDALVSKDNIYLMAETSFTTFLSRYYEERGGPPVHFESLYEMRTSSGLLPTDPVHLYKLSGAQ